MSKDDVTYSYSDYYAESLKFPRMPPSTVGSRKRFCRWECNRTMCAQ